MATTPLQFMSLLTTQEQTTITAAAQKSPQILLFLLMLVASTEVSPIDPRTTAGIAAMVDANLLTKDRADAVLAALRKVAPAGSRSVLRSEVVLGDLTSDGLRVATETHALSDGTTLTLPTTYPPDADAQALLAQSAAMLDAQFSREG